MKTTFSRQNSLAQKLWFQEKIIYSVLNFICSWKWKSTQKQNSIPPVYHFMFFAEGKKNPLPCLLVLTAFPAWGETVLRKKMVVSKQKECALVTWHWRQMCSRKGNGDGSDQAEPCISFFLMFSMCVAEMHYLESTFPLILIWEENMLPAIISRFLLQYKS